MSHLKIVVLLALFLSISSNIYSQDLITFKSGDELKAKVLDIREDVISYKKWDNIEGPTYTTSKDKVFMIKYINGSKDIFSVENTKLGSTNDNEIENNHSEVLKNNIVKNDANPRSSSTISLSNRSEIENLTSLKNRYIKRGIATSIATPIFLVAGITMIELNPVYTPDENILLIAGGASTIISILFLTSVPINFVKAGQCSSKINRLRSNVKISPTLINNYAIGKVNPTLGLNISVSF